MDSLRLLAQRNGVEPPASSASGGDRPRRFSSFQDFARAFLATVACVRRLEDFAYLVVCFGASMHSQNIRYAEVTWTPQLYGHLGYGLDQILQALNAGRLEVRKRWGCEIRWIPDLVRSYPKPALRVQSWACSASARQGGVVALGLGGPEAEVLAPEIEEAFRRCHRSGLPANPHAGEAAGPKSVWTAVKALKAVRIGHGIRSIEDEALISFLAAQRVPLEVCPTSNVSLAICPSYQKHPLRSLIETGCAVTINSDDPALFRSGLADEYCHAVDDCGLSLNQLEAAVLTAVQSTYLAESERASMAKQFRRDFARLRTKHGLPAAAESMKA